MSSGRLERPSGLHRVIIQKTVTHLSTYFLSISTPHLVSCGLASELGKAHAEGNYNKKSVNPPPLSRHIFDMVCKVVSFTGTVLV